MESRFVLYRHVVQTWSIDVEYRRGENVGRERGGCAEHVVCPQKMLDAHSTGATRTSEERVL